MNKKDLTDFIEMNQDDSDFKLARKTWKEIYDTYRIQHRMDKEMLKELDYIYKNGNRSITMVRHWIYMLHVNFNEMLARGSSKDSETPKSDDGI